MNLFEFAQQINRANLTPEQSSEIFYFGLDLENLGFCSYLKILPKNINVTIDGNLVISWQTEFKEICFEIPKSKNEPVKVHKYDFGKDVEIENYEIDNLWEYRQWLWN